MEKTIEQIFGGIEGVSYSFPVYRFFGTARAPSAYIQAALHGDELPGVVAIHALLPMLREAEAHGNIRGQITIGFISEPERISIETFRCLPPRMRNYRPQMMPRRRPTID
jgi:predicted deacylase